MKHAALSRRGRLAAPPHLRSLGFTLFELIIVIVVVATLAGILLGRFLLYQEMAEKTAMEQTAGTVQSALTIQVAGLIARGDFASIPRLADVNPMSLLAKKPANYFGEYYETEREDIPTESWYFDLKRKELVYVVHRSQHFKGSQDGNRVRYKVGLVYSDGIVPGDARKKSVGGVVLQTVAPYRWDLKS